jgi:VRR-NUC domain
MIAQGRKPRARKAPIPRPKELTLHFAVAKLLREHALPDWQWTHVGHGEARDIRTASKLKQMGLRAGWPDFVLIQPSGQLHCLELKRLGEGLSEDQEEFRIWCVRHGVPHVVAHNLDEVLIAFDRWSCLRIRIGGVR